ncbi:hypothetical protein ACYZUD_18715 [Pseudomonas sp. XS1P51]
MNDIAPSGLAKHEERIGLFTIYEPVGCDQCNGGITRLEEINRVTKD